MWGSKGTSCSLFMSHISLHFLELLSLFIFVILAYLFPVVPLRDSKSVACKNKDRSERFIQHHAVSLLVQWDFESRVPPPQV